MDDKKVVLVEMVPPSFSLGIMEDLSGVIFKNDFANIVFNVDTLTLLSTLDVHNDYELLPINEQPEVDEVNPCWVRPFLVFLVEDLDFQRVLIEGGDNRSTSVDRWATTKITTYS